MFMERMIDANTAADRRCASRLPCPAELVVVWHHDPSTTIRCPVLDLSDRGYRIRCQSPLPDGLTGTAMRLLPEGRALNQAVMVMWSRPASDDTNPGTWEIGLQAFSVQ